MKRNLAAAPALKLRLKRKLSERWQKMPLVAENLIFLLSFFIKLKSFSTPNSIQFIPRPQQPLTHKNTFKSPFFQHQTHTKIIIFIKTITQHFVIIFQQQQQQFLPYSYHQIPYPTHINFFQFL